MMWQKKMVDCLQQGFAWVGFCLLVLNLCGCDACPECSRVRFRISPQLNSQQQCIPAPFQEEANKTNLQAFQMKFMLPDQNYWIVSTKKVELTQTLSKRDSGRTNFFCQNEKQEQEACLCLSESQFGFSQLLPCVNLPLRRLVNGLNVLGGFVESELKKPQLEFEVLSSPYADEILLLTDELRKQLRQPKNPLRTLEEKLLRSRALNAIEFEVRGEWLRLTSESGGLSTTLVASFRAKGGKTVRFRKGSGQENPVVELEWLPCE